ncbi:hypothetical protein FS749_010253 [Ceratobasidium sp. UAMH 11750]|nr:hypothetical protein FS749_010253 [Ceratobasidium sp. UAMH 11750]
MFGSFATALALAASVSRVVASPIDHVARGYAQDAAILEDYTPYHVRYLALDCQDKHNTTFFEECCHPLLRWQKLSDRPKQCTPSPSASSSAALVEPTAKPIDEDPLPEECDPEEDPDDDDCDAEPTTSVAPTYSAPAVVTSSKPTHSEPAPKPTSSAAPEPTTTKPAATHEPTTTDEPTTTHKPTTTHETTSATPTTSSAPDNNDDGFFTGGFGTFFEQGGQAGACGKVHSDDDFVVALDYRRYGPLNKQSPDCGRKVQIINTENGKEVTAIVAGECHSLARPTVQKLTLY